MVICIQEEWIGAWALELDRNGFLSSCVPRSMSLNLRLSFPNYKIEIIMESDTFKKEREIIHLKCLVQSRTHSKHVIIYSYYFIIIIIIIVITTTVLQWSNHQCHH